VIPTIFRLAFNRPRSSCWISALLLCLGLASCRPAQAQGFDATVLRESTHLSSGWLVHVGDDPAFALPDFDDSRWTLFNAETDSLHALVPDTRPDVVWYRLHMKVARNQTGLGLLAGTISRAYEIYSNGVKLYQAGRITPYAPYDTNGTALISIPDGQVGNGSIVIALRVRIDPYLWEDPQPGFRSEFLRLGQSDDLYVRKWYGPMRVHAIDWLSYLAEFSMLVGAILLYSTQRERLEYLWLFLAILAGIPGVILSLAERFHTFPLDWQLVNCLWMFYPYCIGRTYCAFVGRTVGWKLQLYLALAGVGVGYFYTESALDSPYAAASAIAFAPFALLELVILPAIILRNSRRSNRAESVLALPPVIMGIYFSAYAVLLPLSVVPAFRGQAFEFYKFIDGIPAGPFYINIGSIADILSLFSLALIILIRSNRVSREQALLQREIEAAKEVQQVILPEAVESVTGFRIESVYEPAQQVGGDFFQILPATESGLLLVIGDVAGKGLPAAMLVSVLVGAIRTAVQYSHSPTEILAQLNERLIGRTRGGFSTALAALFTSDGSVTLANAGHLSPYLDGREVELPNALPLGIVSGATYETTRFHLTSGSRLAFYTDGVIEAQNPQGELFGFERGRDISTKPAEVIAEAAKQFGQQDDITVITIERDAATETSAALQTATVLVSA